MAHAHGATRKDRREYQNEDYGCVPITCKEYFIQKHEDINFYLIDLGGVDWNRIRNIIEECEHVENQCWKAQEDFFDYIRKCDILSYAEKDGQMIGFDAVSRVISGDCCVYNNEETMVLKEYRGKDLAQQLVFGTIEWHLTKSPYLDDVKYFVYTSISANPTVVNLYYNKEMWSWTRWIADCSFKASHELKTVVKDFRKRYNMDIVNEKYPFALRNIFPGSNRFDRNDPRFQFCNQVSRHLPPEFDHMDRGDAFAFMFRVPVWLMRVMNSFIMYLCFGKTYFSRKGLGLFSPKRKDIPVYTEKWVLKGLAQTPYMNAASMHDKNRDMQVPKAFAGIRR